MHVLLTGAAGLIGGEVAARLVARGHRVTGLVHRSRAVLANDGSPVPIELASGDVRQPLLGLDPLAVGRVDLLIHAAATTEFVADEETYRMVNIEGTRHALALAETLGCPTLHISTAYVCGRRDGPVLEDEAPGTADFANGYEASKAAAEALVRQAGPRAAIARPSIVLGDSRTGVIRTFGSIPNLFRVLAHGLVGAVPVAAHATFDLVPIDTVADGIVALAERMPEAAGHAFHLVSGAPLPVSDVHTAICERPGFHRPEFVNPARFNVDAMPTAQRRIYARAAAVYAPYLERDPRFDDRRFRALTGLNPPPVGLPHVRRMIDHALRVGFLKPSPAAARAPAPLPAR